jgi:LacI family fructose operon transcriptional repressor
MHRPTLQQIANIVGVTRVTVSLALRSHPSIPKSTRDRIVACAEKIGYRPNPLISALMVDLRTRSESKKWCALAYATPYTDWETNLLPAARRYFDGAKARARELGYELINFHYSPETLSDARLGKILFARNIAGVLLSPGKAANYKITLPWQHLCTVTLGYTLQTPILNRSVNHQFHTISVAIKKALEYGYKKLGLLLHNEDDEKTEHLLMAGYLAHQATLDANMRMPILYRDTISNGELKKWISSHKPDALLVLRHTWIDRLLDAGIKIPGDVAVVLLDRSNVHTGVAGIDQRPDLVGAAGIDLVTQDLMTNNYGLPVTPKTVLTEGVWIDGDTLPRRG